MFLAKQTSVIRFGLAGELPLDDVSGVHPGDVDAPRHLGERVLHRLPRDQRPAEGLPVAAPLDGQVQAALRARIRLRGKPDALGDERRGDLQEAGVLGADQVGGRHPHVGVGQLGGVRGAPAHLVELAADLEARACPCRRRSARRRRRPGPPVRAAVTTKSARTPEVM